MQQVEVQRVISSSIDKVWQLYTNHRAWARFLGASVTLEPEGSPAPGGVGCVRHFWFAGRELVAEEVTLFEAPDHMQYRIVRGGGPLREHQGDVVFAREGEGTRVTWRVRFRSTVPGLGPLLRLFLTGLFRHILRCVANELKRG